MMMSLMKMNEYVAIQEKICEKNDYIAPRLYDEYGVNRGLRDDRGVGVLTGLTNISKIVSSKVQDGKKVPCDGELWYRGYRVENLIGSLGEDELGFEKVAYLLLMGELPNAEEQHEFEKIIGGLRTLPSNFTRDVIMKAPTEDIMNSMTRSILTLASYDKNAKDTGVNNSLRQCIQLISEFPMLAVYGYNAYNHYVKNDSMFIHRPAKNLSTAENILMLLRPDKKYSKVEAKVLDTALILHMEHGGGNNSTFTTRVVTSSGSDTYSTMAAAMSSLKGPKHGGANIKVVQMMQDLKEHVDDVTDEEQVRAYLRKLVRKEAFDRRGLIYGMGHAVYSISDPRARAFKQFVELLAEEKNHKQEFELYSMIERIAPEVIGEECAIYKGVSANVDFYSGFVYTMLNIPEELFTPLFAIARITGWSAHRLEELLNAGKIIRPAYKYVGHHRPFVDAKDRGTTEK